MTDDLRERIAVAIEDRADGIYRRPDGDRDFAAGLREAAEIARATSPWTAVGDGLPEDRQRVIVAWTEVVHRAAMGDHPEETVIIGPCYDVVTYIAADGGDWDGGADVRVGDPIFWMPLEPLPRGGDPS